MTISGISAFFKKTNIPKWTSIDLSIFKGQRVAIETATYIYKYFKGALKEVSLKHDYIHLDDGWVPPSDQTIDNTYHKYIKNFILKLQNTGIIPVLCIEGKVPDIKINTCNTRNHQKDLYIKRGENIRSTSDCISDYAATIVNSYFPTSKHKDILISICKEYNIEYIQSKYEAEGVAANLVLTGNCEYVLCEDHDVFMYGPSKILSRLVYNKDSFTCDAYSIENVLTRLGFKSFVDFQLFCILCGTDYHKNIYNYGPSKLHKLYKKGLTTYDAFCNYDEKFKDIPYNEILNILESNKLYI